MAWMDNFDRLSTASIYRRAESNVYGEVTYTNTLLATIKCAVWQNSASERFVSDRIHNPSAYTLACDPSTAFQADDICVIGNDTYDMHQPDNILGYDDIMTIGLELKG